ncbi:hypothetical protein ECDEC12A_4295 [Escherichia coli DEC12A]|uniref:Uncharacterized protein n=1 Tax=Escherichia coli O139:H28 (strain E24377A / ETEC) TaxID=331111 RepID=A7ZT41_ECO24|nr:hypothetical protein EcE24377A_3988 [Escherichia coli O139:H28 str. E24377A]EGJ07760.1 hypothetical protein SSJG_03810 [Escherichia coli D9]EHX26787.1 hypothetical protein ECDEC12A_4295 [Escherichia coli DEC12A]EHY00632.1 hypothetical protein ECDEC15B_4095 [Escherichia coli DEC15B]EIL54925.1 hypothetical protein ECKD2_06869 [Escherichia coli KD2]EMV55214.1 hypothetical protein EC2867750_4119 [Escherichia coli 2867750]EMV99373.1 hypothetical protein EC2853500_4021 [Escherichia coli 2853500]
MRFVYVGCDANASYPTYKTVHGMKSVARSASGNFAIYAALLA